MFVLDVYPRSRISDPGSILPFLVVPNTTQLKLFAFEQVQKTFEPLDKELSTFYPKNWLLSTQLGIWDP